MTNSILFCGVTDAFTFTFKGLLSTNPAPPLAKLKAPRATAKVSSRGTLVVCAVSLVGQWVEEAKSKLTDSKIKIYAYV